MNLETRTMLLGIGFILFGIAWSVIGLGTNETLFSFLVIRGAIILGMLIIIYGYFRDGE